MRSMLVSLLLSVLPAAAAAAPDPPGVAPLPAQVASLERAVGAAASACGLRSSLDAGGRLAASAVAEGRDPLEALRHLGRPAARTVSLKVPGSADPQAVVQALLQACRGAPSAEPWSYASSVSGSSVGLLLWLPSVPAWMADPLRRERQVQDALLAVNLARSKGALCGAVRMPPAPPLALDSRLRQVALDYAARQVREGFIGHVDPRGAGPLERLAAAGLRPSASGENLAYGLADPRAVVEGWLASPGHCLNLMDPRFTRLGMDYFLGGAWGVIWSQVFSD